VKQKIIFFELNEVPFRILDEFCRWRPDSNLARLLPRCTQFETVTEDEGHLSPWVTWPSLHRGVANSRHGICEFGQDLNETNREFPPIWQLLARQGVGVGVFGSMHSYPPEIEGGEFAFYVPDTFAAGSECFPKQLSAFQEFNLAMVQGSARNVSRHIAWKPALSLLARAPFLGLTGRTMFELGKQIVSEKLEPMRRVRRRTSQVVLAFDLFMHQLKKHRPAFTTFFTNHVASSLHRYWAAAFPEDYSENRYDDQWRAAYGGEIEFTMTWFDRFFGRLVKFVNASQDYRLMIATSMGQEATDAKPSSRVLYCTAPDRFMSALGVAPGDWTSRPAMAPDVCVHVQPAAIDRFRTNLHALHVESEPIGIAEKDNGFFRLRFGVAPADESRAGCTLHGEQRAASDLGLSWIEIEDQTNTNAYHIPQGMLLEYNPHAAAGSARRTQISTLDVAPYLLRHFGVRTPDYMQRQVLRAA